MHSSHKRDFLSRIHDSVYPPDSREVFAQQTPDKSTNWITMKFIMLIERPILEISVQIEVAGHCSLQSVVRDVNKWLLCSLSKQHV
jgi:hypothetical protein